jgi:hypothetical protein
MRKTLTLLLLCLPFVATEWTQPIAAEEAAPALLVHYMPWYTSKPVSGRWGYHWTMNHYDPDIQDDDGRRQVASHQYPLVGAYDSSDPDLLECQVLLMKFAGIDGVIIDWYGIKDFRDYDLLHQNTLRLIPWLKRAGLTYSICYEDQTLKHMVNSDVFTPEEAPQHAAEVMTWMQSNWFNDPAYQRVNDKPLLLVFGPQYLDEPGWEQAFAGLNPKPFFSTLNTRKVGAESTFGWPPVNNGETTTPEAWRAYLDSLPGRVDNSQYLIPPVFSQFHDIYEQAGVRDSYGHIAPRDGQTFTETLQRAWSSDAKALQVVTWNDYGEGTSIEPTVDAGYTYLEAIQDIHRTTVGNTFLFTAGDLRKPIALYENRKKWAGNEAMTQQLNEEAEALFARAVSNGTNATHTADQDADRNINISELLRVVQLYNGEGYACDLTGVTEDGYLPTTGPHDCTPHNSDYLGVPDWTIDTRELLQLVQLFHAETYEPCADNESGFCIASADK